MTDELKPLRRFRRKAATPVVAIQLLLDTDGITYRKWGDHQRAQAGDWLVNNAGDVYTVDQQTFAKTYKPISEGLFEKVGEVWAREAGEAGTVATKEGQTAYKKGDYLVANDAAGTDTYAISAKKFHKLYEPIES